MERKRETVLVDMDGVIAGYNEAILSKLPRDLARVTQLHWILEDDYPEQKQNILEVIGHPRFFYDLPVYEGALEGWQRIIDAGYDPVICSAPPMMLNKLAAKGKRSWLSRHFVPEFGRQIIDRAIFDSDKYKYDAVAIIDDSPAINTGNGRASWEHVVFSQTYNTHLDTSLRIDDWHDPTLEETLAVAHEAHESKKRSA